ncbi:hypothetical protein MKEN_01458500 [Mycena kentingensis (nom. inval.)]|nr:hypothetical protein MKEN_01458500 [Mycena kentingensis (nom. inval.)]
MALPPQFTTDITGRFTLNVQLRDRANAAEPLNQLVSTNLAFNHYLDEAGEERIWVEHSQRWIGRNAHTRTPSLDRIRRIKTSQLSEPFPRAGWTANTRRHGVLQYNLFDSAHTWATDEAWGVEEIAGERRFVRQVRYSSGPTVGAREVECRFVYDYVGAL